MVYKGIDMVCESTGHFTNKIYKILLHFMKNHLEMFSQKT